MNKIFLLCICLSAITCSCSGGKQNGKVKFQPQEKTVLVDKKMANNVDARSATNGCVALSVLVQADMDEVNADFLKAKFINIVTRNGIASNGVSPQIVIAPIFNEVSYEVTSSLPQRHKCSYYLTIYIGNLLTGEIFGSVEKSIIGVGDSKELALRNAISSIGTDDGEINKLISVSEQKIVNYYTANGKQIIQEALGYAQNNNFDEALALLNSIPKSTGELYAEASKVRFDVIDKYINNNSDILLNDLKAALGEERDNVGGFSQKAMAIYRSIPKGSKAEKEADRIYDEYIKELKPEAKLKHEKEMREWDAALKQMERQHELDMYKTEMSTKVAIEGQAALLEKYKKDVNYNKMSWIGKLFYFGRE